MNRSTLGIGFRLNDEGLVADLLQRATVARQSVHEVARSLVIEALTSPQDEAHTPGYRDVLEAVAALRADLTVALEAILIGGRILPPDQARHFVREKLTSTQSTNTRP